jgi:hypothetical protein
MGSARRQRPLSYNAQHSQEIHVHVPGGIRTSNPSKQAAADPRLRPLSRYKSLTEDIQNTNPCLTDCCCCRLCTRHEWVWETPSVAPAFLNLDIKRCDHIHAPAALLLGHAYTVLLESETRWTPERVWTLWKKEKSSCPSRDANPRLSSS